MKERIWKTAYQVYESADELPEQDRALLQFAKQSLQHSYSPYSNFQVGAAVLLQNGKMVGGANQENASYPLCLCAERVALAAAASQFPGEAALALAVTVHSPGHLIEKPAAPCGACRQVICETECKHQHDIRILLQGETGEILIFPSAKDLLPFSFDGSYF